jgi:hypothetical protein
MINIKKPKISIQKPRDSILLGYDYDKLKFGIKSELSLPLDSASYLVFGPSNSGKTVLNKLICAGCADIEGAKLTICDGKSFDYRYLRGIEGARFHEGLALADGLTAFFEEMQSRKNGNPALSYRLIVLEEWSTYLRVQENFDRKAPKGTPPIALNSLTQLFAITSEGRAYNFHALVSCQRPDSQFLSGFRENLTSICGLGRISPEAARMVGFNEYPEFSGISGKQGQGWLLTEQGELNKIIVPRVKDFDRLHADIITAVTR